MKNRARPRSRDNFWSSAYKNSEQYLAYYNSITQLAIAMFEWKNLPLTCDERFLESVLYSDGVAVMYNEPDVGLVVTRVMLSGELDIYNIPIRRTAYASNGLMTELDASNSVLIWNNFLHTNSVDLVNLYSRKLWDLDRTIEVNARAQKTPVFISCEQSQRMTMVNLYKEFDGNSPVIWGNKGSIDPDSLKVLRTDAPFVGDKLYNLKREIWNECLTFLGISNISVEKRERLIQDEVMRNMGGTIANRYTRLEPRRQACKYINEIFGTNIECDYREDVVFADEISNNSFGDGDSDEEGDVDE